MVRIRLQRLGRRNRPFYRISVIDERTKRDGKLIEHWALLDNLGMLKQLGITSI